METAVPGQAPAIKPCPQCGYLEPSNDDLPDNYFLRPWHVRGPKAVKTYVESLGEEAHEWLLALFVDKDLQLLAVDTVARGTVSGCVVPIPKIMNRAYQLKAAGFILVHNHPSGDPTASQTDMRFTARIARMANDLDLIMFDHLIVAGDQLKSCGLF